MDNDLYIKNLVESTENILSLIILLENGMEIRQADVVDLRAVKVLHKLLAELQNDIKNFTVNYISEC